MKNTISYCYCPDCSKQIEMETDLNERMVDTPDSCENCGYKFSQIKQDEIYQKALEDGWGSAIDQAHDLSKEQYGKTQ